MILMIRPLLCKFLLSYSWQYSVNIYGYCFWTVWSVGQHFMILSVCNFPPIWEHSMQVVNVGTNPI